MNIITGEVFTCTRDGKFLHLKDGAIAWEKDTIVDILKKDEIHQKYPNAKIIDKSGMLIAPGFIDCHLHFPQYEIIGCYGEELLGWLNKYTFPEEISFKESKKAKRVAERLTNSMFRHGTTCGVYFSNSHFETTKILFETLSNKGARGFVGKVAMDRFCPDELIVQPNDEFNQTEELIKLFHGKDKKLYYALTPRFAPTSTEELLSVMTKLKNKYPDLIIQTHYAENKHEIEWVKELFPSQKSYLDVYDHYGLIGKETLLAHSIHVTQEDLELLENKGSSIIHCPTSNLFLGSGLFPFEKFKQKNIKVGLGTDIGGGTTLSMWKTLLSVYEIQKVRGNTLTPVELFQMATLDSAETLGIADSIGSIEVGKQADFQVIDPNQDEFLKDRFQKDLSTDEMLFSLVTLADDRVTDSVFVAGSKVWNK